MSDSTSVPQEDQIPETMSAVIAVGDWVVSEQIVPCWKCRYCLALPDRAPAS
jgi:hypothetical protein